MSIKPALKLEPAFRSGGEKLLADQLEAAGIPVNFEKIKLKYTIPTKEHTYTPDFHAGPIIIEFKGGFGVGPNRFSGGDPVKERQKLVLVKEQHPDIDLRIVFQRANTKIRKGSPTTYGMWATKQGFKWSDKSTIPLEWIKEMQQHNKD
jgi:hypothetical protein